MPDHVETRIRVRFQLYVAHDETRADGADAESLRRGSERYGQIQVKVHKRPLMNASMYVS